MMKKIKQSILYTVQCLTAIFLGMEVAIPPNPYRVHLVVCLTILICIKHDIVKKLIHIMEKYGKKLFQD